MKLISLILGCILFSANCFASTTTTVTSTTTTKTTNYVACNQPYALCTTAPCTPIPGTKDQSICSCVVKDGASIGALSCDKRKPATSSTGQLLLTSNFSFENSATNKVLTCTGNHAWTNCLDKPCIVDPHNSNQATCTCDIKYSEKFLTYGGQCSQASCETTLYSGASFEMNDETIQTALKALNLTKSPMQNCPAT